MIRRMSTATDIPASPKLSVKTKLLYGVGDTGNAIMVAAVGFYLMKFYTDAALIAPALAAGALMFGKVWDAFNDPLFGWISDRVRSPFGRRRIFMLIGAVPFGIACALLWIVPKGFGDLAVFVWITVIFMVWGTLWTMTNVPYDALSADLTDDYDERTSLIALRMIFAVSGFIIGAALTPAFVGLFHDKRFGYGMTGILYGILATATLLICVAGVKERRDVPTITNGRSPIPVFLDTLKNRPFVQLIIGFGLCNFAFALVKTLLVYLLTYRFHMESRIPFVMLLLLASVAAFLYPWKIIAGKLDKGPAFAIGLGIGVCSIAVTFFLPPHETPWMYLNAVVAGAGFASNWVLPWAMVPDVVEYDRAKSGEQRSGVYFGLWGLVFKMSEALGIAVTGWVLQVVHYVPNVQQAPEALLGIRLFAGPVPALIFLASLPLFIRYPITRKKHQEIRDALK